MTTYTFRLPADLADRFEAVAASAGSRSRALRLLIERVAVAPPPPVAGTTTREIARTKITIAITSPEMAEIEALASARQLKRTEWVVALIRSRLSKAAPPPKPERQQLVAIRRELRRIGINLNQAIHALHAAGMENSRLDVERESKRVAEVARETAHEIDAHIAGIGAALKGDLAYWTVEP